MSDQGCHWVLKIGPVQVFYLEAVASIWSCCTGLAGNCALRRHLYLLKIPEYRQQCSPLQDQLALDSAFDAGV